MELSNELKTIKRRYGERFMKLCRESFSTILEEEGLLLDILSKSFATNSKTLYDDIVCNKQIEDGFKEYIYSKVNLQKEDKIVTQKAPYELLEEAGYDLYECKTEEEIQSFKKYYTPNERLCTFSGGRLNECVVFFAVKKNVDKIKRHNFKNPQREDEYGTSVLSIQFYRKGACIVSIKNRYNHTVGNPDATFGNDLDKIIPGLTNSFETLLKEEYGLTLYNLNIEHFSIPGYIRANDGRYYKYNMEINGKYYCPGNIVIDGGQVHKVENSGRTILMDYFILDVLNKTIKTYDARIQDSFVDGFKNLGEKIITKEKHRENRTTVIRIENREDNCNKCKERIIIELDENNRIIGYKNEELKNIGRNFLKGNRNLNYIELTNLESVEDGFLYSNRELTTLELLNLKSCGSDFLYNNECLNNISLPELEIVKGNFLCNNINLTKIEFKKLKSVGSSFLHNNINISKVELEMLEEVGTMFLKSNANLESLRLPRLKRAQSFFINDNRKINGIELPSLEFVNANFLFNNLGLTEVYLPQLTQCGENFLCTNRTISSVSLPNLETCGANFLCCNEELTELELLKLKTLGNYFMADNNKLISVKLPELYCKGSYFLSNNKSLINLETPNCPELEKCFAKIIKENTKKNKKAVLSDISKLDILSRLQYSEIAVISNIIEKMRKSKKRDR